MNQNLQHYYMLEKLVTNSLTALYLEISTQKGYWTVKKRNDYLIKFLKSRSKMPKFAVCKKDIKAMLVVGRNAKGNLEKKLWELNQISLNYKANLTQADELYILLTDLFEQYQFPSLLEQGSNQRETDVIYMKEKRLEQGFDENNKQIKPLTMTVKTARLKELIDAVQAKGTYRVEVESEDEQGTVQLLIHRSNHCSQDSHS